MFFQWNWLIVVKTALYALAAWAALVGVVWLVAWVL